MCDVDERTCACQTGLASYTVKVIESNHQIFIFIAASCVGGAEEYCIIVLHNAMLKIWSVGCDTVFSVLRSQDIQF